MEGGIAATAMAMSVDLTGKSAENVATMAMIGAGIETAGDATATNAATGTAIGVEIGTGIGTIDATAPGTIFVRGGTASRTMKVTDIAGTSRPAPAIHNVEKPPASAPQQGTVGEENEAEQASGAANG